MNHQEKIADKVLEEQGIKLSSGRKRSRMNLKGMEDVEEIDINQRAIRDEVKFKKEGKLVNRSRSLHYAITRGS